MKRVGVTGSPGSGKTTLWRAITGGRSAGEVAAVEVPEPRLDRLVEMHSSRKRVAAQIEVVDVHAAERTKASALSKLREMDAILLVAPTFSGGDALHHVNLVIEDLILADLQPVETRLERARKDASSKEEVPVLESAKSVLEQGKLLSSRSWEKDQLAVFSPLSPLTLKSIVVVLNSDEKGLERQAPEIPFPSFSVAAALEAEIVGIDQAEAFELLSAYGVVESALWRVIHAVYRSLDLITFLTTSDKESRAWEVHRGATAPEAAGVIHSDLQRGFIRAEVISFDELEEIGSWEEAKAAKRLRLEGKDYIVAEGDVVHFRFAV